MLELIIQYYAIVSASYLQMSGGNSLSLKRNNHNNAIDQTEHLRSNYGGDVTKLDKCQLANYMMDLLVLCEDGIISRGETAFLISETYWSQLVRDDPQLESIAMLATMLEVPSSVESGNPHQHWSELVEKIHEINARTDGS